MAHPAPFDVANSPWVFRPGSQSTIGPQPEKAVASEAEEGDARRMGRMD
jgi:hypothetical protein